MTVRAVLFDFSGTLFRLEQDESWLTGITDENGRPLDVSAQAELMRRMTAPVGQVVDLDAEYQHAWVNRDLDQRLHRKVYLEVLRQSGITVPEQALGLYERLVDPSCWTPYPDTVEALRRLRAADVRVAVVSNIAFDIRPAFDRIGVGDLVDEYVLSYVEGMIKPEPALFLNTCHRLGVEPEEALMVGDSPEADGGAAGVGCEFAMVRPDPTTERPDSLLTVLADHGVAASLDQPPLL
ncbi:HAD family hydrolase [Parasphingorhabdus pacifica]